jgi:hypothetical protein
MKGPRHRPLLAKLVVVAVGKSARPAGRLAGCDGMKDYYPVLFELVRTMLRQIVEIVKFVFERVDITGSPAYTQKVVRTPLCWTGEAIAL